MSMTFEQEKEHLDFLITRLQFMKMNGNDEKVYDSARRWLVTYKEEILTTEEI